MPVVRSIWLSKDETAPVASVLALVRSSAVDRQLGAAVQPRRDLRQVVLGGGEQHADRRDLGDDDDAGRIGRLQIVAGVDEPQADAAADRRDDAAIGDVELGGVDLRLVGADRRLVLRDGERLILDLLAGDRILLFERLVTRKVGLGLVEQRRILGELRLRQRQRRLIGTRVDLGEEVALLDHLPFLEADLHQPAGDLGLDGDRGERRHGAERVDRDRHVADRRRRVAHGLRRPARTRSGIASSAPARRLASSARQATPPRPARRSRSAGRNAGAAPRGRPTKRNSAPRPVADPRFRSFGPRVVRPALRTATRRHQFTVSCRDVRTKTPKISRPPGVLQSASACVISPRRTG